MDIPVNNEYNVQVENLAKMVLAKLNGSKCAFIGCEVFNRKFNPSITREVAKMFSKKGFFCKINFRNNGNVFSLEVSATPLRHTNAAMLYSVLY